uniref:PCI domain-containing protein n=1 Tax=Parastrongyloides trichosuri TaxID=131310 RepID=A0A0N4ZFN6_PARTI
MSDDDDYMDNEYELQYSDSDNESEPDVNLENQYYSAKAHKSEGNVMEALTGMQKVLELEDCKGEWGFKALKQMVKMTFKMEEYDMMLDYYKSMLGYTKSAVTKNYSEKSISNILELISTAKQKDMLKKFYEVTLNALESSKNDRCWFKTKLKLGRLFLEFKNYSELQKILAELRKYCNSDISDNDQKKATQLLEVYALEIELHTALKNTRALQTIYNEATKVEGAISHPLIMGVIYECGGKMHLFNKDYDSAHSDFFAAFKCFDETGSHRRLSCLKYYVLASMLIRSKINPFESQETKAFKNETEVVAMTNLVTAYQDYDLEKFQNTLIKHRSSFEKDEFIKEYVEELERNIRCYEIKNLVKNVENIKLSALADKLKTSTKEVECILKTLIVYGELQNYKICEFSQSLIKVPELKKHSLQKMYYSFNENPNESIYGILQTYINRNPTHQESL